MADEALDPTVSMRSNPGGVLSPESMLKDERKAPSSACRRVKGLRIGILSNRFAETENDPGRMCRGRKLSRRYSIDCDRKQRAIFE